MNIKFLDDQEMVVSGGITLALNPFGSDDQAAAETRVVDGKGATLETFLKVLSKLDPYGASGGNLIVGDGANAPGVSFTG